MKITELAYFAGFFDGEGSVYIHKPHTKKQSPYTLTCTISNTKIEPLQKAKDFFGGSICEGHKYTNNHKPVYSWTVVKQDARRFLMAVLPYLIIKTERATLGLDLQALCQHNYPTKGQRGFQQMPEQTRARMEQLSGRIRVLNHRGVTSSI